MKGKSFSIFLLLVLILTVSVIIASIFIISSSRAYEGIPQSKDAELIQEVIMRSYKIEAIAARTFDLSSFPSVFVNDQRGGALSSSTLEFIRSVFGDYSSKHFGYLDYKVAYYSWWKSGAIKFEALQNKAIQEERNLTRDEIRSLVDDKGRVAMPRSQAGQSSIEFQFISIEIEGDKAIVVFDDGLRTNQMILVKIYNEWFIAGSKILSLHP